MATRTPNPQRVKIHRTYTIEEAASLLSVHRNTVRNWIKDGLPLVDDERPLLILGFELARYLKQKRKRRKRPCGPGELYCFRCRAPRKAAGKRAKLVPRTDTLGALVATCAVCQTQMNRQVNISNLRAVRGDLDISIEEGPLRIGEAKSPILNCDQT